MTRWDEILTLPVQSPPTLEFSAADIMWSMVEGWRDSMDRLALIPYSRVNDFVRGESNNRDCPTRFHVEARRRRSPSMNCKPKVDGILEYILYWCSFGPDDHRKGGNVRPSRPFAEKRKTPAGRPNTKRGCVCHFIVKRLIAEPSVALVIYNHNKHVDKKGMPCHGPMDKMAVGTKAMFAPYISDELRLQVMSLLYVGIPVETIMQRHTKMVEKQGGPSNRDDLLTHRYVRRLERKIRRSVYELDDDDTTSIDIWVENHQDCVFFYEDFSDTDTFVLGIQTDWQLQQMIQFGSCSLLASDSKFGTNKLKYPVHSILVFDNQRNAIPVAWIITPNFSHGEIYKWMGALYDRAHAKDPTWQLGGFIIDDPLADVRTIRELFQCPVLISLWRIRHAWHKNLISKCSDVGKRSAMAKFLGDAISSICRGSGDLELFEAFLQDFVDCAGFLDYFKALWFPRLELATKVHSYYWLDEYSGKDSFSRYWRSEWSNGPNPWRQGLQIPDSDVVIGGNCARVISKRNREKSHVVWNPGSEFALCDCNWSMKGNLCKHAIKSTKICRDRGLAPPSLALFRYYQALAKLVHCPPSDTLIGDHAMAVAVSVKTQLDAVICATNGSSSNTSVSSDPKSVSKPRESEIEETNTQNGVCASPSKAASGDDEDVPVDKDSPAHKKRKSGNAWDSSARKKKKSGEASDGDEDASTEENSNAYETSKSVEACADDEVVSMDQDSPDHEKRKSREASVDKGTSATQIVQPSETESSQATDGLNGSSVEVRLAERSTGT
ncbi:hypothetical protein HU200_046392 [Digitaria exilis]|uniref:SWIM-type domain-containing protein n=1 Tax=Digitaria exilis TaxID=1010633 RepID=A0A835B5U1_9POAL|nr:hypothetical protein HU200_046392 [Digitaria exilis]